MSVQELTDILRNSRKIVFFGGAGVSTASGIPDFRSANGLWNQKYKRNLSPEEMVSRSFFERDPEDFFAFYKDKLVYPEAKPNACHYALARLEKMGRLRAVVTQNIDGLHQMAGSKRVYELHGSVHRNTCLRCHKKYGLDYILDEANCENGVPKCSCGGVIKPDVVLYGEMLDDTQIRGAVNAISDADVLIIGGTSLVVYPAAGFVHYFTGDKLVILNKSETAADSRADLVIHDPIGEVLGECLNIAE